MKNELLELLESVHYKQFTSFFGTKKVNQKYKEYLYKNLLFLSPSKNKLSEYLYCFKNNLSSIPLCKNCSKSVNFDTFTTGYRDYCCRFCSSTDKITVEKRQNTLLEIYGVDNIMKTDKELENRRTKSQQKNGVDYFILTSEFKNKSKETTSLRYGVNHTSQLKSVQEKRKKTNQERYGCDIAIFKDHYKNLLKNIEHLVIHEISFGEYLKKKSNGIYSFTCRTCNSSFKDYLSYNGLPKCSHCNPLKRSKEENEIKDFILSLLPGVIIQENKKNIIYKGKFGLELDLFLPEYNFAIEYNGFIRHSFGTSKYTRFNNSHLEEKLKDRHFEKTTLCEEEGITLLHIGEKDWLEKKEKIKNYIKSYLGLLKTYKNEEIKISNNFLYIDNIPVYSFTINNNVIEHIDFYGIYNLESTLTLLISSLNNYSFSLTRDHYSEKLLLGINYTIEKSRGETTKDRIYYTAGHFLIQKKVT